MFGEHDVMFMNEDEMISISHIAYNRKIFAKNALKFAIKLFEKQEINGLFDINMLI